MAHSTGGEAVRSYIASLPVVFETKVLRQAARAGAIIVADEAKERCISDLVAGSIKVSSRQIEQGRVVARVQTVGKGAFMAPWLEYGTSPHFISVAEDQRQGLSIGKINKLVSEGSLVIGGNFVGDTVFHPGARPHPFLRVALDVKIDEAIAAAQGYIDARVARGDLERDGGGLQ